MCSSIPSRNRTVVCVYWYRDCCYVGGNQLGEHGLQLFVFLLPSWAIMWMYCMIDIHIIGIRRIGGVDWLWSVSSVCGLFGSGSFLWGFVRCLCRIMCDGWERKRKPRLLCLAREALVIVVIIGRVIIIYHLLLLFSKFKGAVGVSVVDSIKLGRVSVGEMSCCGITGCLSCRGKQSTSSSSSSGRSLLLLLS